MADNIVMVDFPILYTGGTFRNLFRAFVEENIQLRMQNDSSCTAANFGGDVQLSAFATHVPSAGDVGKEIVIIGGNYQPTKGTVVSMIAGVSIQTDITFNGGGSVRFFFAEDNLRMKYRFVEYTGVIDLQSTTNLFGNSEFVFYPDEFGDLYIDISIIKQLLVPSFTASNDYNDNMAKAFEVQYQTRFDGNTDTWHSAHDTGLPSFEAFVSAHATGRTALIDIFADSLEAGLDTDIDGRMWRGYDKIFSILTPEVETPNDTSVNILEQNIAKANITSQALFSGNVEDGLLITKVTSLNAATRFCIFRYTTSILTTPIEYEYNLTVYDTNGDNNEFYLTWISDNGTIRQWLFTNKILFQNDLSYDALTETNFRPIPSNVEEIITIEAKGISAKEREYISSLFISNKIQVENNGDTIECVIDDTSWDYENRSNSYIVTIQLKLKPVAVMNV